MRANVNRSVAAFSMRSVPAILQAAFLCDALQLSQELAALHVFTIEQKCSTVKQGTGIICEIRGQIQSGDSTRNPNPGTESGIRGQYTQSRIRGQYTQLPINSETRLSPGLEVDFPDSDQASQSSYASPSTRLNSRTLCVTKVAPCTTAIAAISKSLGPIIEPDSAKRARMRP